MDYIDPHIHMVSRTTDDYATLARMGCVIAFCEAPRASVSTGPSICALSDTQLLPCFLATSALNVRETHAQQQIVSRCLSRRRDLNVHETLTTATLALELPPAKLPYA